MVAPRSGRAAEPALGVLRAPRGRRGRRRRAIGAAAARHLDGRDGRGARDPDRGRHPGQPRVRHDPACDLDVHRGRPLRLRRVLPRRLRALLRLATCSEASETSGVRARPSASRSSRSPLRSSSCFRCASLSTAATRSAAAVPTRERARTSLLALQLAFAAWSLVLLVIGVRVVHGWSWPRSLAAVVGAAALLAAIVGVFVMI